MRKEKIKQNLLEKYREIFQKYASKKGIDVETYVEEFIDKSAVIPGKSEIKAVARNKDEKRLIEYINTVEHLTNMNVYESETKELSPEEYSKYGSLEPANFEDIDDLNTEIEESNENKPDLSGLDIIVFDETKNKPLLDKYKDEITRVIFGNHFSGIMGEGLDFDEEINQDLTKIIKKGEEKYGENFITDLINNKTNEEVYTTLKELKLELKKEEPSQNKPDLSGLDKIVFDEKHENGKCKAIVPLKEESKEIIPYEGPIKEEPIKPKKPIKPEAPIKPKKGIRKQATSSLIKKWKEKMNDPKFRRNFIVGAVAFTLAATAAAITAVTGDASYVNDAQIVNNMDLSQIGGLVNNTIEETVNNISQIDYSQIGENSTVFSNAIDATNHTNSLIANEWFQSNPLDVYNTQTNEYMNLTQEQLNNMDFMKNLASDPNNALLYGESLQNPSGFVNLSDVISENAKGMSR